MNNLEFVLDNSNGIVAKLESVLNCSLASGYEMDSESNLSYSVRVASNRKSQKGPKI